MEEPSMNFDWEQIGVFKDLCLIFLFSLPCLKLLPWLVLAEEYAPFRF